MAVAKIIWVDDEIESLQSQKLFLENKGYEVQTFTNGFDAIDFVKDNLVDVVLIDETMPGITGLETLAKIKAICCAIGRALEVLEVEPVLLFALHLWPPRVLVVHLAAEDQRRARRRERRADELLADVGVAELALVQPRPSLARQLAFTDDQGSLSA